MAFDDKGSRRTFLKTTGGAAVAAALAGCGGNSGGGNGGTTSGNGSTTAGGTTTSSGGSSGGKTLTYARGGPSSTLDPQNTTSGEDAKVINQIYDRLIEFKPGTTNLVAGLATDWKMKDTTVTLHLRKNVTFHNGETFTADDVIATYRRFTDSSYQYYAGDKYISAYGPFTFGNWVQSVSKKGDYQVTFELKQKYAPFLRNLAMFASNILSEKAIKQYGQKLSKNPVGTGPFKFDSWDTGNAKIRLTANTDYWGDGPNVDEVVFTAIQSNTSRAQTLASGGADIIDGLGYQSSQVVKSSGKANLLSNPGINVGYMAFNFATFKPFREQKVRQAISYAVDTKAIVDNIFKGIAEQASQAIPSSVMGYNKNLDPYPHDVQKAKKLLSDAGYGDGFTFELATFKNARTYNPSPVQAAQVVKSNLSDVGITVKVNQMPFNSFLNYTESGKHDACFLGWMTDNGDPDNFYYTLMDPGVPFSKVPSGQDWVSWDTKGYNTTNASAWANTDFMHLIRDAQSTYDDSTRASKYKQAAKIAYQQAPWVFMDHAQDLRGVANGVSGFQIAPISGPFLNLVSLD